jgi:hypothetical protein
MTPFDRLRFCLGSALVVAAFFWAMYVLSPTYLAWAQNKEEVKVRLEQVQASTVMACMCGVLGIVLVSLAASSGRKHRPEA